jgi:hypothetical protein
VTEGSRALVRMIALCPACHEVKHMGLAGIKGRGEIAAAHLAENNGWTPQVTAVYIDQVERRPSRRDAQFGGDRGCVLGSSAFAYAGHLGESGGEWTQRHWRAS